jgi:hypothetical protein
VAENETEILEKLAAIYVVSFDDIRAVEIYEALRAKAAYYGLLDVEIRALVGMAYPLSWSNAQRFLEMDNKIQHRAWYQKRRPHPSADLAP